MSIAAQNTFVALVIGGVFSGLGAATMAWAHEGTAIWIELRLADFANCFVY